MPFISNPVKLYREQYRNNNKRSATENQRISRLINIVHWIGFQLTDGEHLFQKGSLLFNNVSC